MAHFHSTGPATHGQPTTTTWMPAMGYSPVEQQPSKEKAHHVSVQNFNHLSTGHRLSRKESYRPFPHKTLPLVCLAVIALGLIGALEYTLRVLPQTSFQVPMPASNATVVRRQETIGDGTAPPPADTPPDVGSPDVGDTPGGGGEMSPPGGEPTFQLPPPPPPESFLNPGATTGNTPPPEPTTTDPGAYINAVGTTVTTGPTAVAGAPNQTPVAGGVTGGVVGGVSGVSNGVTSGVVGGWTGSTPLPDAAVASGTVTDGAGSAVVPTAAVASGLPGGGSQKEPILHSPVPLTLVKNPANYFLSIYAGVLIAILLRLLIGYLFRSTKLVDPFFMLSAADGSPFPLWEDHLGCETLFAPYFAARNRRWLLLATSVAYAAAQLLSPFASELTSIHLSNYNLKNGYVRGHSIWVNPTIVRLLQALLGVIFCLLVLIWCLLRRTQSSIRDNPASLAVIASLVAHPTTSRDLQIDQWADKDTTARLFAERMYQLGSYTVGDAECYGIVPITDVPAAPVGEDHAPTSRSVGRKDSVNLLLITASAGALFALIMAYLKGVPGDAVDRFLNSQSFGPRFVLSALGLLLKSPLLALSARTVASVPFRRLAARPRRRADLRTPIPITPQGAIFYSLGRRAWYAGGLAIVSGVVVEFLLILLPGVPFNAQLAYQAAQASWYGSLACLGMVLFIAAIGWIRLVARPNEWPKSPTTLGAVAMYVAGTAMSTDAAAEGGALPNRHLRYAFHLRAGRWVVDYADGGDDVKAPDAHEPTLPFHDTAYHSPAATLPHPPAPTFREDASHHSRSGSFDAAYPGRPHFRASLGGQPLRDDTRGSVSSAGGYPGRPQYGA